MSPQWSQLGLCDMESASQTFIHEWLSKTEEYDQSSIIRRPLSGLQSAGTKPLNLQQDLVHPMSRGGLPIEVKRTADIKLRQTLFAPTKGELRRYERRPRHKTKEDHYEYNESFRMKERHRTKSEKKSIKKNRKHTINDNFHASNVPGDRVTLGFFRKGRASSAVKTAQVPLLVFSETDFLKKGPLSGKEKHWANRDKERKGDSRTGITRKLRDRFSFASPPADSVCQLDFVEGVKSQPTDMALLKIMNQHTGFASSPDPKSIRDYDGSDFTPYEDTAVARRTLDDNETPRGRSRIPKPCTAAQYAQTQLELERLFDLYCNHLLLFDLASGDNEATANISNKTKRYWNLDELKSLLEKRQRLWGPNETGTTFAEGLHLRTSTKRRNQTHNTSTAATGRPFKRRRITSECGTEHESTLVDYPSNSPTHCVGCNDWPDKQQGGSDHMMIETGDWTAVHSPDLPNMVAHTQILAEISEGGRAPSPPSQIQVHGSRKPTKSTSGHGLDRVGDTTVHPHNDAGIAYDLGGTLYTADLDAEYEGILHSEGVPPGNIMGGGSGNSINDTTGAGRNGCISPVAQEFDDYYGLTVRPLFHTPLNTVGSTLKEAYFPSPFHDTDEIPQLAQSAYGPKHQGSCHDVITARIGEESHTGDSLASNPPIDPALELTWILDKNEPVLPDNFWRQNKLY